ncbi:hypothetical protein WJX81_002376 [Elliptochloris bilobata]|uniref:rRNA methyltransferase 1, mitochondrial n=1 Tax=Elliptochloris bilobata TaxID=381761 RepID=A0AAW1S8A5_9CHLO
MLVSGQLRICCLLRLARKQGFPSLWQQAAPQRAFKTLRERGAARWREGSGGDAVRSGRGGRYDSHPGQREQGRERGGNGRPMAGNGGGGAGRLFEELRGEALYGVNPVLGALKAGRRKVHVLYVQDGLETGKRKDGGAVARAVVAAKAAGGRVEAADKHDLNLLVDHRPHQGLVLDCSPLEWSTMNIFPEAPAALRAAPAGALPVWLALDEIGDPQNLGAALRVAYFLGVTGVLCCGKHSAPLSPAVSKASAGAMERMDVFSCASMPRSLTQAASRGWHVIGAGSEPSAVDCRGFKLSRPAVLVVGSEGRGLRPVCRRICEDVLRIAPAPWASGAEREVPEGVDSLNVSVATGILLHHLLAGDCAA